MVKFRLLNQTDLDPEKIGKFDDPFDRKILNFLQKSLKIIIFEPFLNIQKNTVCSIFHSTQ